MTRPAWCAALLCVLVLPWAPPDVQAQATRPARRPAGAKPVPAPAAPVAPRDDATLMASWLAGHFSNEAQAPLKGISPGGSEKQAQDRLHVHVKRVQVPSLGDNVLLVQWNRDRSDGPIARQRLWAIAAAPGQSDRVATMRVYGLRDTETFVDALASPEVLQTLQAEDLFLPGEACDLPVSRVGDAFVATTLPACPSGVALRLPTTRFQVRLRARSDGFTYSEAGYADPDFTTILSLPYSGSYEFQRVK